MRMRMLPPHLMCRMHLQGEHYEIHKHRPSFVKHHSIAGRISPVVQIEPANMKKRHDELAAEMLRRGGNHNSPYELPDLSYLPVEQRLARVDIDESIRDLRARRPRCECRVGDEGGEG